MWTTGSSFSPASLTGHSRMSLTKTKAHSVNRMLKSLKSNQFPSSNQLPVLGSTPQHQLRPQIRHGLESPVPARLIILYSPHYPASLRTCWLKNNKKHTQSPQQDVRPETEQTQLAFYSIYLWFIFVFSGAVDLAGDEFKKNSENVDSPVSMWWATCRRRHVLVGLVLLVGFWRQLFSRILLESRAYERQPGTRCTFDNSMHVRAE